MYYKKKVSMSLLRNEQDAYLTASQRFLQANAVRVCRAGRQTLFIAQARQVRSHTYRSPLLALQRLQTPLLLLTLYLQQGLDVADGKDLQAQQ